MKVSFFQLVRFDSSFLRLSLQLRDVLFNSSQSITSGIFALCPNLGVRRFDKTQDVWSRFRRLRAGGMDLARLSPVYSYVRIKATRCRLPPRLHRRWV